MELWDFEGRWRLERRVRHDDGRAASFAGEAEAARDGEGLRWHEAGILRMGGRGVPASRTLLWRVRDGGVAVLFADGRPFHRIDLRAARPEDVHPCGADLYRVSYDLAAFPLWSAVWRVDGPRHAYRMETRHAPLAEAPPIGHPRPA